MENWLKVTKENSCRLCGWDYEQTMLLDDLLDDIKVSKMPKALEIMFDQTDATFGFHYEGDDDYIISKLSLNELDIAIASVIFAFELINK